MIKLRPIKINCNWEDEVDEYLPKEPFQEEWDKDYGSKSKYADHYNYIIPYNKVPRSLKLFLESSFGYLYDSLKGALVSEYFYWAESGGASKPVEEALGEIDKTKTEFHDHGGSVLITFKLKNPNSKMNDWDLEKLSKTAFDSLPEFWEGKNVHELLSRNLITEFLNVINGDPEMYNQDTKKALFMTFISGTEIPGRDLMEMIKDDTRWDSERSAYIERFLKTLTNEDLVEKLIRVHKITNDAYNMYYRD